MKKLFFSLAAIVLLAACGGDSDEPTPGMASQPGFSIDLSGSSVDETWTGQATFRPRGRFIGTHRYTIDLEKQTGEKIIINVLIAQDANNGETPPQGTFETGQFGPNSRPPLAEFYTVGDARFRWVDNPGTVTITRSDSTQVRGTVDVSIPLDGTSSYVDFTGTFLAVPE